MANLCPCCSGVIYTDCCAPYHNNQVNAPTPETLMRSRYSAYSLQLVDYLMQTTHPSVRSLHDKKSITQWAKENRWLKLEIFSAKENRVRFKAHYQNGSQCLVHHEDSTFELENGLWYYLKGSFFDF